MKPCCCDENGKKIMPGKEYIWKGTCTYVTGGSGAGFFGLSGWNLTCYLASGITPSCEQFLGNIDAYGVSGSVGLPLPISFSVTKFQVTFNNKPRSPNGFKGAVTLGGASVALAKGLSYSFLTIGEGRSGFSLGSQSGFDLPNGSVGYGRTFKVDFHKIPCNQMSPSLPYF